MVRFNHGLLVLAREARAWTQADLALATKIAQGTLSKYETGFLEPPEEIVQVLASALSFPSSFFYEEDKPYGFPPYHYRKRKTGSDPHNVPLCHLIRGSSSRKPTHHNRRHSGRSRLAAVQFTKGR